jgi:ribosomal protein S18 acetylase RimI-like enzyme
MDYTLRKIPFTEDALPAVQDFNCGDDAWALEVTEDLKNPECIAAWVKSGTAEAWLYITEQGELVGFGTLSERHWRYPNSKKSPRQPISVIPDVGVDMHFQGQPNVPGVKHYSDQILDHLRFEARQHTTRLPVLGLCVHPENKRAIAWYSRVGFTRLDGNWTHPVTNVAYWRMALDLVEDTESENAIATATRVVSEQTTPQHTIPNRQEPTFNAQASQEAGSAVVNVPQLPEQQAKKAARKARAEARRKHADANWGARKVRKNPKHGRR